MKWKIVVLRKLSVLYKKKNQIKEKKVCDPLVFIVFDMLGE